jgi:hypothetical protein
MRNTYVHAVAAGVVGTVLAGGAALAWAGTASAAPAPSSAVASATHATSTASDEDEKCYCPGHSDDKNGYWDKKWANGHYDGKWHKGYWSCDDKDHDSKDDKKNDH